jgi:hypothetical protein
VSHASDFPSCPPGGQASLTKITVDNRNFYVHPEVAPLFKGFLEEITARGYSLDEGILDDWSFLCRPIRGSETPSEHSRGTAIDINAVHNPMGSTLRTDMPWWVPVVAKKWGLRWGGDYTTRKDAMHFEFIGTIAEARAIAARNHNRPAPANAPDTDGITPTDSVEAIKFLQVCLTLAGQHIPVDGVYGKQTGQAIKNLKTFFNDHRNPGAHIFDVGPERGWMAGPKFLERLSQWLNFLKSQGAW